MDAGELLARKQLRETTVNVSVDGETAELLFRALPRKTYRVLLEAHPGGEGQDWNPDTFPPALIAACSVTPEWSLEQATELWEEWEVSDSGKVFMACWKINEVDGLVGFTSPGSAQTSGSGQN